MRYALIFEKGETARWLGHLDVMRTFERALRRSHLPVAFTGGFNPRIKLAFASALGVGSTGSAEAAVLELTEEYSTDGIAQLLNASLPPCFRIHQVQAIPFGSAGDYLAGYTHARIRIWCRTETPLMEEDVVSALEMMMLRDEWIVMRTKHGKTTRKDIRPCLEEIILESLSVDRLILLVKQHLMRDVSAKPMEVAGILGEYLCGIAYVKAHRIELAQG